MNHQENSFYSLLKNWESATSLPNSILFCQNQYLNKDPGNLCRANWDVNNKIEMEFSVVKLNYQTLKGLKFPMLNQYFMGNFTEIERV